MSSSTRQYLETLAALRGDALVVTAMRAAKVWPLVSRHPRDVNYLPSAMGHAGDIALGLAIARPDQFVICVNGDGCLLMNLGSLVTVVESGARNLTQLVMADGKYSLGGGSPVPGAGRVDFAALARAAGWPVAMRCATAEELARAWPELRGGGPALAELAVEDPADLEMTLPAVHPRDALRSLRVKSATLP